MLRPQLRPNDGGTADGPIKITPPKSARAATSLERDIIAYVRDLPGAFVAESAATFGQPKAMIAELLGRAT